jgi:DNA-binding NarL/FixJ family response regulator
MERAGVTVVARIARGEDLIASARSLQPDVVIMDVEIPGQVRGWQALVALKTNADTKQIPVIAYADLDFPWYVPDGEHASLERACLELADVYIQPHRLCFEIGFALRTVGIDIDSLGETNAR